MTKRHAERLLLQHNLAPSNGSQIRELSAKFENAFGVTFSGKINGRVKNHRDLVERLLHRLVNLDQGLANTEKTFPNIHSSARERWSTRMLTSALCTSLPKARDKAACVLSCMYS